MYDTNISFCCTYVGEIKETKAYKKWAKKISEIPPPTSPPKRKSKWVFLCHSLLRQLCGVFKCQTHISDYNILVLLSYRSRGKESESNLFAVISQRQSSRKDQFDSMFTSLISKYGGAAANPEPTDEEFEAAQKRVDIGRTSKKSKRKWSLQ